ncbi:MAG: ATP-binding protein [candidate division KSB1 bacterium]
MSMSFFNREEELAFLQKKYRSKQPELLIFRGRRRVGKTFLLKEFSRRVHGLYLLATVTSVHDQLQLFSQRISNYFNDPLPAMRPFATGEELIDLGKHKM